MGCPRDVRSRWFGCLCAARGRHPGVWGGRPRGAAVATVCQHADTGVCGGDHIVAAFSAGQGRFPKTSVRFSKRVLAPTNVFAA
ncbi:hypothetical protein GCM10010483_03110 [Actinokineospora diospyrosa]